MSTRGLPAITALVASVGVIAAGLLSGQSPVFSASLVTATPLHTATPHRTAGPAKTATPTRKAATPAPTRKPAATPTATKKSSGPPDRYIVLLISDGARYDEWDLAHMPNLAALVKRGTTFTQATVGQLSSITETSHATLGTGVYPYRHGILGDNWRVPGQNKMTPDLLSSTLDQTGYIEKLIKQQNVPTIAGIVHRKFPRGAVVTMSGHKVYAATAMGAGADYTVFGMNNSHKQFAPATSPGQAPDAGILKDKALALKSYPRTPGLEDHWTTNLAQKMVQRYRPRLLMINYPEIDNAGHIYGTNPKYIEPIMTSLDKDIGRLESVYKKLGILSKTDFIVTSDHGMVQATNVVQIGDIENVIKNAGASYLSVGHGDWCPIWLTDPTKIPTVAQALVSANLPHVRAVYMKDAQGKYVLASAPAALGSDGGLERAYSDLLATYDNISSPDIVMFYDENTITMTPTFQKVGRLGDHEGATWGAQHIGLFMAGPGIKQNYVSSYPARLVDIPVTIAALFTAHPAHTDGIPLADALTSPFSWMSAASTAVQSQRAADVAALAAQQQLPASGTTSTR